MNVTHTSPSESVSGGKSKVDRYGWIKQDARGQFQMVHKVDIHFDEEYQRELNISKSRDIAANWSWVAFGTVTLASRGGRFFAMDGMHRIVASRFRSDVELIPAMVFKTSEKDEEAASFLRINKNRKPISSADTHKAMVLGGDEVAIYAQKLLDNFSVKILRAGEASNCIRCMGVLHRLARTKRHALSKAFPLVAEICKGKMLKERILEGLVYIEENATDTITSGRWRSRFLSVGYDELIRAAGEGASFYAKGGARPWAHGMMQRVNKGMRSRLTLAGAEDDG